MSDFSPGKPICYHEPLRRCQNCKFVFCLVEHDDPPRFFCTFDAPPRPRCGSIVLNEAFGSKEPVGDGLLDEDARFSRQQRRWHEWAEFRQVQPWGICDENVVAIQSAESDG